jgi:hypothetical protein
VPRPRPRGFCGDRAGTLTFHVHHPTGVIPSAAVLQAERGISRTATAARAERTLPSASSELALSLPKGQALSVASDLDLVPVDRIIIFSYSDRSRSASDGGAEEPPATSSGVHVWNGHSCPLPLTLMFPMTLILTAANGGFVSGYAFRHTANARTTVEERRFSAA